MKRKRLENSRESSPKQVVGGQQSQSTAEAPPDAAKARQSGEKTVSDMEIVVEEDATETPTESAKVTKSAPAPKVVISGDKGSENASAPVTSKQHQVSGETEILRDKGQDETSLVPSPIDKCDEQSTNAVEAIEGIEEGAFKCPVCPDKGYPDWGPKKWNAIKNHMNEKHGMVRSAYCHLCDDEYETYARLRTHLVQGHGLNWNSATTSEKRKFTKWVSKAVVSETSDSPVGVTSQEEVAQIPDEDPTGKSNGQSMNVAEVEQVKAAGSKSVAEQPSVDEKEEEEEPNLVLLSSFIKCRECDKTFPGQKSSKVLSQLEQHMNLVHGKVKRLCCHSCTAVFKDFGEIRKHLLLVHNSNWKNATVSEYLKFTSWVDKKVRLREPEQPAEAVRDSPSSPAGSTPTVPKPMEIRPIEPKPTDPKLVVAKPTEPTRPTPSTSKEATNSSDVSSKYSCPDCGQPPHNPQAPPSQLLAQVFKHMKEAHGKVERGFQCPTCPEIPYFKNVADLKNHMTSRHEVLQLSYDHTILPYKRWGVDDGAREGEDTTNNAQRQKSVSEELTNDSSSTVHSDKRDEDPYRCPECGFKGNGQNPTKVRRQLEQHMSNTHGKVRRFWCTLCTESEDWNSLSLDKDLARLKQHLLASHSLHWKSATASEKLKFTKWVYKKAAQLTSQAVPMDKDPGNNAQGQESVSEELTSDSSKTAESDKMEKAVDKLNSALSEMRAKERVTKNMQDIKAKMARLGKEKAAPSRSPAAIKVEPVQVKVEPGVETTAAQKQQTTGPKPSGPSTSKAASLATTAPAARPDQPRLPALNCPHVTYPPNLCFYFFETLVSVTFIYFTMDHG